ncbi:MAG: helix-turn-helix transcriptional regulator [Alphaproteobacteria bacterium]|jgi:transcriptional regulator with XRE-family HTH domain|nr:helix-turn-helix transcriptional regulator [Alphaproteobacteria bacterium]MDE2161757.1 helix-turn-helix transcriptional regulator [Alphaproteobacteria bacterium]MDE2264806.1 helix-turn-helix transcriptional regulator [Alphaproteobacteria bacterium]MDE2499827.1 helix-turn-helix transcriptional regulator [Alphaproteobacteria bacterium]
MTHTLYLITASQLRAARALLGLDQRALAERAGLSHPTVQRMEASEGVIRGNIDSLGKLVSALEAAGIELLGDGLASNGLGRGVRLRARDATSEGESPTASTLLRRQ